MMSNQNHFLKHITMVKSLNLFRDLKISKAELRQAVGEDLHNVDCKKPCHIKCQNVINAIQCLQSGELTQNSLVEWVNVIWFTALFVFDDKEAESIISVLEVLETLDEDGVSISDKEFSAMIISLTQNTEYTPL